ncbi:tRNA wybutosine-synthesizing protein 4 [Madurella mycetomatis]|uniref:tRNA wybutosine-synthesizing protein 4 n=1 Tax=Madurella mycetomatis TaxID=100816 RepID=A0A175VVD0_9PEZI|nr:tRNA wybutosine-synthesizing protein 4 [Madurella mycetomatis]
MVGKPSHRGGDTTAPAKSAQAKAQDDQVMAQHRLETQCGKALLPERTAFFSLFCQEISAPGPLINRGYWLRLRVIDVLVRNFLKGVRSRGKRGVVVNLGCGSDVLPWQCLTRYPGDCSNVKFVDVDFPDLMKRKRQTVLTTPELLGAFTGLREGERLVEPVVFESDQYVQIGCDLRALKTLRQGLVSAVGDFANCEFIFVAEVSITYMETEGADEVIRWASSVGNAEFVLLEQILPGGEDHPFASAMLSHFHKLNTPLKSVHTYPTVPDQHARFSSRNWDSVQVWTLWQTWADKTFLDKSDRKQLDEIEPFDEWEEFALFASHYCVVHAKVGTNSTSTVASALPSSLEVAVRSAALHFDECPAQKGQRRFAAAAYLSLEGTEKLVLNALGLGAKSRLQSCDIFSLEVSGNQSPGVSLSFREGGPATRMCHSLTDLGSNGILLVGGRGSPSSPLKDCWLFDKSLKAWRRTHDLPTPLYRHAVTALGDSGLALLFGGRGETAPFDRCLLYHPDGGWMSCEVSGDKPAAVYGAVLSCGSTHDPASFSGIYAGGLEDGLISDQLLLWEAVALDTKNPQIRCTRIEGDSGSHRLLTRFGATCLQHGSEFLILGGVAADNLLDQRDEIVLGSMSPGELTITRCLIGGSLQGNQPPPRPLFVGHSAVSMPDGSIVVVGGGATCFSMGTFWNRGAYSLHIPTADDHEVCRSPGSHWVYDKSIDLIPGEPSPSANTEPQNGAASVHITPIIRLKLETEDDFLNVVRDGRPAVLEGLDLGSCVSAWTAKYLVDKVGSDRKVVVHEAATPAMDFNAKNFRYVTTEFGDFVRRVELGDKLYLRALSHEKPSEKPAVLAEDFQGLAPDFVLPPQLSLVTDNLFSSVLRMSGPVNMWLHYDVMANVYCQIGGSKRLILFPPSDVEHLSFAPGASSSSIDVFSSLDSPELARTRPCEAVLMPGEVLFLPPLWLHTAQPTSDQNIAVNVFFRDLDSGHYAAGRDVYGNRDLAAYEKGRQDVARIANSFQRLPAEAREFYLLRLADELRRKARA